MKCIWFDSARKVVGLVTDAKTKRSFLFCRTPVGARPSYFELDATPRPIQYGEKVTDPPSRGEMITTGRKYAQVLIADGKVKLPAKDAGKKPTKP